MAYTGPIGHVNPKTVNDRVSDYHLPGYPSQCNTGTAVAGDLTFDNPLIRRKAVEVDREICLGGDSEHHQRCDCDK